MRQLLCILYTVKRCLMLWSICGTAILIATAVAVGLLIQRKIHQTKIASKLVIHNPDGIVEERFVRIGSIEQWVGIRGEDRSNPVLLIIHGGPASSYSIFTPLLRGWEQHFTLVQWDQRGCGKTFARNGPHATGTISMEQFVRDGMELAEYIRGRLNKDRLLLLASSFGSTFGVEMARRRPDLFYAYIGTDQNVGMVRGREQIHTELLQRLREAGLSKGLREIERIGTDPTKWSPEDFTKVAQWTMKSDPRGYRHTMKLLKDAVWYAPDWTLRDMRAYVAGMKFTLKQIQPEFSRYDAWESGTQFEIPFFVFQGEADVLTSPSLAECYYNDVVAPLKAMRLISGAGHFAAFLQPEQFLNHLLELVRPLTVPVTLDRAAASSSAISFS
jgi:pimeloyl-ACP methyl ester carboxylesterase